MERLYKHLVIAFLVLLALGQSKAAGMVLTLVLGVPVVLAVLGLFLAAIQQGRR